MQQKRNQYKNKISYKEMMKCRRLDEFGMCVEDEEDEEKKEEE